MMLYLGAIVLGALHAFEPGHGKTLIASYMIGARGRIGDGVLLGLIVTFTHTFSVIVLGAVAKFLSRTYSDAELHAWLGLFSSLLILVVGLWILRQRMRGATGHDGHGHAHHHHDHSHGDNGHHHDHEQAAQAHPRTQVHKKWDLLLLGISGGLVPCPAAIATLLAAIGAGRIGEGLAMALFFSFGLGLVMMGFGVTVAVAGNFTSKISENQEFGRRMSILSGLLITALGIYGLVHSLQGMV